MEDLNCPAHQAEFPAADADDVGPLKLVRDKLVQNGKYAYVYRRTTRQEHLTTLLAKIVEEAAEVLGAPSIEQKIEELADLLTVIEAYITVGGIDLTEVLKVKADKLEKRGGFLEGWAIDVRYPKIQ